MPPQKDGRTQRFKGLKTCSNIIQDGLSLLRAVMIGSFLADRNHIRSDAEGVTVRDTEAITDPAKQAEFKAIEDRKRSALRTASKQMFHLTAFTTQYGISLEWTSVNDLEKIQDALSDVYRIVVFNYHRTSQLCSLRWSGEHVRPKVIYLVTNEDNTLWDAIVTLSGVFEKSFFCPGCLEIADSVTSHKCDQMCPGCAKQKVLGHCKGTLNMKCKDCNFYFQTNSCYIAHKHKRQRGEVSRCDTLHFCEGCRCVYRARRDKHDCSKPTSYCSICRTVRPTEHDCAWAPMTERQKERLITKQSEFRWAFYDLETSQTYLNEQGERQYLTEHLVTTVTLVKVCSKCSTATDVNTPCTVCGERVVVFNYKSAEENNHMPPTEDDYRVIDAFCDFLLNDRTMSGRILYAHNGGRFDTHLVLKGFTRVSLFPHTIVNKGSTLIIVEYKRRGGNRITLKDSYTTIPMALSAFAKAFALPDASKGSFPHYANMRCNWNRVWDSVPPKDDFGYKHMKPEAQKEFNEWYSTMEGKPWNQDEEIKKYCLQDVLILMAGCLSYRKLMIAETGWCPFTVSCTVAGYTQFVLRANYLNAVDFPYLPEAGYGSVRQSKLALLLFKYMEKDFQMRGQQLIHAHSPQGEKVFNINGHRYSVDAYEPVSGVVYEFLGCYFHGCLMCYGPETRLVGGETAKSLNARTMGRIRTILGQEEVSNVKFFWECGVRAGLRKHKEMAKFFMTQEVITRLFPRDALYGGRVEVLRTMLKRSADVIIRYYDIVSMYPACMALNRFPLGQPRVITSGFEPVTGLKLPYEGLIKLRILAPRNLLLPVLPLKIDSALFFSLCSSCAKSRASRCTHESEQERSWVGTYTTIEVERALKEGYKVLKIYEVWSWTRWSSDVYKPYFRKFMKMKYAASGFPSRDMTEDEMQAYCEKVSSTLGFDLQPNEVFESAPRRTVAKLCNNSTWGKLAEKAVHLTTQFVTTEGYIKLVRDASREIKNFKVIDDDTVMVSHQPKVETVRANKYSAVHHAAFVTSYARIMLYDIVQQVGAAAAYMDTDSIMFDMPRGGQDPLAHLLTGELGELSDETKEGWEIEEVIFAGCKNYSMKLVNTTTGETKMKNAFRGFPKDAHTLEELNHERISDMVLKHDPAEHPVTRPTLKRKIGQISTYDQTKVNRPVSKKRATRGAGELEVKVPFGFVGDADDDDDGVVTLDD